jgi:hypothetical protein
MMIEKVVNPVAWVDADNDTVWQSFSDAKYRPGKMVEFQSNIDATVDALKERNGSKLYSARALKRAYPKRHIDMSCDIVCAGPSLPEHLVAIEKRPFRFKICLNAATRYVRPHMVVWGERTADPYEYIDANQCFHLTWLVAPLYTHPNIAKWRGRLAIYNHGVQDGLGALARTAWREKVHSAPAYGGVANEPMLELPGFNDSFELAFLIALWMGFRRIHIFGLEYCWYEEAGPYGAMPGSKPMTADAAYAAMEQSGLVGVPPKAVLALNYQPYQCGDGHGHKVWTHYYLARRAERAKYMIQAARKAGVSVYLRTHKGLVYGGLH